MIDFISGFIKPVNIYAILKLTITINYKKPVAVDAENESSHGVAEIKLESMQIHIHLQTFAIRKQMS